MTYKRIPTYRESVRLQGHDYSSSGLYVVTICTKDRKCFFGNVIDGKMELNDIGKMVWELWAEIPNKFENVKLDAFVVMPNHVHGIVIIGKYWGYARGMVSGVDAINRVRTKPTERERCGGIRGGITGENNPMLSKNSLPTIMRWYKGRCSFEIRKMENGEGFKWHSRYYDQVIKNKIEFNRIRKYIRNNPSKWKWDNLNPRSGL